MRRVAIILLCFLALAATGCSRQAAPQAAEREGSSETSVQPQPQVPPANPGTAPVPSGKDEERFDVTQSESVPGWYRLQAKVYLHRLTGDQSSERIGDRMLEFSLDFPDSWSLDGTVFYNRDNEKVAEIAPPVLLEPDQEKSFLAYGPSTDFDEELISLDAIQVGSYKGTRAVTKTIIESGYWYPYIYSLSDGTYGIRLMFFSTAPSDEDQELFDRVANTFAFGE